MIDELVRELRSVIAMHPSHIAAFAAEHRSFEGWFSGEFVKLLYDLRAANPALTFEAGRRRKGGAIDFTVVRPPERIAIELKAWPIRRGREQPSSYLTREKPKSGRPATTGIEGDIRKLAGWKGTGSFLVAICYGRPETRRWRSGLYGTYAKKFANNPVQPRTRPGAYPPEFFIGVLQLI